MVTLRAFGHIAQMTRLCSIPLPKGRRDDNLGNYTERSQTKLSFRPERTRISCHTALDMAACAPFCKGKAHEVHQRHQGQQEIRGERSGGICGAPFGLPKFWS